MRDAAALPALAAYHRSIHPSDARVRRNLSVHRSEDGGRTWPSSAVLYARGAAYSDASLIRGGEALAYLFERDNYRAVAFGSRMLPL